MDKLFKIFVATSSIITLILLINKILTHGISCLSTIGYFK